MEIGRITFRVEGEMWNAYWSQGLGDKPLVLMGAIRMTLVQRPRLKKKFMRLMQDTFSAVCEEAIGRPVDRFREQKPERPRGGEA